MDGTSLFAPGLAAEYRASPRGRHSPALQHLLALMRLDENCLDLMIVETVPHAEWTLATGGTPGLRPRLLEQRFPTQAEAEWEVFRRRWIAMGGPEGSLQ
jgi:hypothetical protein